MCTVILLASPILKERNFFKRSSVACQKKKIAKKSTCEKVPSNEAEIVEDMTEKILKEPKKVIRQFESKEPRDCKIKRKIKKASHGAR